MDWFKALLIVTAIVRGMGAGMIYDVAIVGLDTRNDIGIIPYARFARSLFARRGKKTFVPISLGGALLTIVAAVLALSGSHSEALRWWLWISVGATVLAFIGTSQALPAITKVRHSADDVIQLAPALDRFAKWHSFTTLWQFVSFAAQTVALVYL